MIEITVCDDDSNDLDYAVNMLHDILTRKNIEYNINSFLFADEMLNNITKIDIGILDIAMKNFNGIDIGRKLKIKFPNVKLLYMTNYKEYCMQAVNQAHAFSFLCKPLDNHIMQQQIIEAIGNIVHIAVKKEFYKVTDSKNMQYSSIKLVLEDILYIEYIKRQRKISITLADKTYECKYTFRNLAKELEQYGFAINCRGMLVNLAHIEKIKGFILYLDNGQELQIAQKRIVNFKIRMNEFLQQNLFRRN